MKKAPLINEPKERLSATLEEHMRLPQEKRRDKNSRI